MDYASFGLTRRPFRPTPDAELYYSAAAHEAALAAVERAWQESAGVAVVEGEPGTGKTLLGLKFLASIGEETPSAIFHCPRGARAADLLQAILFDLGRPYEGKTDHELRLGVQDELLKALAAGTPLVLLLDEGQNLTAEVLEELRLMGNVETNETKALFTLILAQPGLRTTLAARENAAFAQRIAVRAKLPPLTPLEAGEYLRHQLRETGGRPDRLLNDEALALLARHTGGIPRVLNRAAALSFALAASAELQTLDAEPVLDALLQLELLPPEPDEYPDGPKPKLKPADLEGDAPDVLPHPANSPRSPKPLSGKASRKPQAKRNTG